jgi:5S rRNA maturation endonuclease (ribonuclease M5)
MKGTEEYVYQDENGVEQYKVVRRPGKRFHIESLNGSGFWEKGLNGKRPVPYNLPAVKVAVRYGQAVYICEGEQDCNSAAEHEMVATCNHGGAGKWTDEHSKWLIGAHRVIIIWDLDAAGEKHALEVSQSLRRIGVSNIQYKVAAAGKDLTDHLGEGYEENELLDKRPVAKPLEQPDQPEVTGNEFDPGILQLVLEKLRQRGKVTTESGKVHQYNTLCPAHDDNAPSMSVSLGGRGQIIFKCHTGCSYEKIANALGINRADLSRGDGNKKTREERLADRVEYLAIDDEAKTIRNLQRARNIVRIKEDDGHTGADELLIPEEEAIWVFDSWFPNGSMVLLNADRKTGKTRLCLSIAKAICDQEPFLGRFETTVPDGARVLYLNYEMPASTFRRWFRESEFKRPENFLVRHLKGRSLPFNDITIRDELANYCARNEVHLIIFDTQIKAMTDLGVNENDNSEVTGFHAAIEALMEISGVPNVILPHHIGKTSHDRGRGASRIEDGVDVIWTLAKGDGADDLSSRVPRHLAGEGRDVQREPVELVYNDDTGLYTYEGISAARRTELDKVEVLVSRVLEFRASGGRWPSFNETWKLAFGRGEKRTALIEEAVSVGRLQKVHVKGSRAERYKVPEES